ncbi:MAG: 23S rRNA (pseudouridine(1915)-N(3))-methyltransferase RlmH [Alphaproteobacteria bacterium]
MRIIIAAVGRGQKTAADETAAAIAYLKNAELMGARLGFGPMALREVEDRGKRAGQADTTHRKQREGELLLSQIPDGATLVALDGRGHTRTSEIFAGWLGQSRDQGCRNLVFVIGGADGLSDQVIARASWQLSLGAMTWPHLLVRMMLAEQIYRAVTILANHPYHRG